MLKKPSSKVNSPDRSIKKKLLSARSPSVTSSKKLATHGFSANRATKSNVKMF